MKRKPYNIYLTGIKGDKVWGTHWVVESTVENDSEVMSYLRAVVKNRKTARELVKLLKRNFL